MLGLCELRVLRGFKNLGVQGLKNFRFLVLSSRFVVQALGFKLWGLRFRVGVIRAINAFISQVLRFQGLGFRTLNSKSCVPVVGL